MSGLEERFDAPPDPVVDELRDEISSLRTLLTVSLICLIVLTLSVDRYLFKQISIEKTNANSNQQLVDQLNAQFSFNRASEFWNRLVEYSKTHPEMLPIINRYSPAISQTVLNTQIAPAKR